MSGLQNGKYTLLHLEEEHESDSKHSDKLASKSSMWQSVSNLVSDVEGTGLLALPYVIQKGGLLAITSLAIVPWICYYTGKVLIECLYVKNDDDEKVIYG